jgi:hypothetical protein
MKERPFQIERSAVDVPLGCISTLLAAADAVHIPACTAIPGGTGAAPGTTLSIAAGAAAPRAAALRLRLRLYCGGIISETARTINPLGHIAAASMVDDCRLSQPQRHANVESTYAA